jgi:membrane associated rhomboid family serine protease
MNIIRRVQYNAPVTLTFAFISLAVLGMASFFGEQVNYMLFSVYRSSWSDPLAYVRVFTHIIGHGSINHYFNNFLMVLLLGPIIEEKYGSKCMLIMMIITAFVTGVFKLLLFSDTILLGASGIVFMLIILSSFVNLQAGRIPLTFILVVCIFIGQEIFYSISVQDNISRLTHIIGGICGAVIGYYLNRKNLGLQSTRY